MVEVKGRTCARLHARWRAQSRCVAAPVVLTRMQCQTVGVRAARRALQRCSAPASTASRHPSARLQQLATASKWRSNAYHAAASERSATTLRARQRTRVEEPGQAQRRLHGSPLVRVTAASSDRPARGGAPVYCLFTTGLMSRTRGRAPRARKRLPNSQPPPPQAQCFTAFATAAFCSDSAFFSTARTSST